ncbi:MAG: CHAD domain-containing protein [Cyanobacteriota bacterium]
MAQPHPLPAQRTNGELVLALVARQVARLTSLQAPVLADQDPEPLHQMRVAMRRLRTTLRQFAPVLILPSGVRDQRIAKSVRRLGLARDLDVLRERLEDDLVPELAERERRALEPVFRQLRRERRIAYDHLVEVLRGRSHLELLARLQDWLRQPRFTPLGEEPLHRWLGEWQLPPVLELYLHPGWRVSDAGDEADTVHDLRKQIKEVRYRLENLRDSGGPCQRDTVGRLRQLQELLGDWHDLEVLAKAIDDQMPRSLAIDLPELAALLQERRSDCWVRWRQQAAELGAPHSRRSRFEGLNREASRLRIRVMCSVIPGRVSIRMAALRRAR